MRQVGTGKGGGTSGGMSAAEALRFYREFKKLKEEAGLPPSYDPKDRDAIRRGFFGDGYGTSLKGIERSRKARPPGQPRRRRCGHVRGSGHARARSGQAEADVAGRHQRPCHSTERRARRRPAHPDSRRLTTAARGLSGASGTM